MKAELCSHSAVVATVSSFRWPWAFHRELPPTTTANSAVVGTRAGYQGRQPLVSCRSGTSYHIRALPPKSPEVGKHEDTR